jgi:RNA polymerase sigma-70 factor (ECF subfamily)
MKRIALPDSAAGGIGRYEADALLAAALAAGDADAATEAWTRLSPLVLQILRRHFGSSPDCQDLCQEVFLRFFSRIAELRNRRALRSFLIGICLGVAQNERRRGLIRRLIALAPNGDLPDVAVASADHEAREALRRFCRALASFDAKDRALFIVRNVEMMEVADIAAARRWPLATTKRRVARVTRRVGLRMKRDPALIEHVESWLRTRA